MTAATLTETLARIQEAFRPVFDAERATWAEHGPAAVARLVATGATLHNVHGNCPVQATGTIDGLRFYFRARGEHWEFRVAATDDAIYHAEVFSIEREYPGGAFAAGWMDRHEAVDFIVEGIAAFRTANAGASV